MSSINVYVRTRPALEHQKGQKLLNERVGLDITRRQIHVQMTDKREKVFKFDNILDETTSQEDVYECVQMDKLLKRVIDGYHSTLFAYGQTGSGKTFTIQGGHSIQKMGLIPRAIHNMYRLINSQEQNGSELSYKVSLSFLQIYNEQIYDLIDNTGQIPLKMRWNKYQQFVVEDLFEPQCRNVSEAIEWWKKGQKNKIMDSHQMNNESSRSHCILTIRLKSYEIEDPTNFTESKLEIVDLAGSQRQKVTKSTGIVFREGIQINKSLFALRQVINSLYEANVTPAKQNLPPYRDSKLTSLLKQSIGGNAYCVMIACLNPTLPHFQESLQTLTYASMATYISNKPLKNIDPKIRENRMLMEQNYNLKQQNSKLSQHIQYLTGLLEKNVCQKCKQTAASSSGFNKIRNKSLIEEVKLPKFNASPNRSIHNKGLAIKHRVNQSQHLTSVNDSPIADSDTDSSALVKKNKIQSSVSENPGSSTPKIKSSTPNYQLKNPKQILQSISMIKDLIGTNTKLRDKIQLMRNQHQKMEKQMFQIHQQNQLLRDRWEILSSNLKIQGAVPSKQNDNEAPISLYQRLLKQQNGQKLVYNNSSISHRGSTQKAGNHPKTQSHYRPSITEALQQRGNPKYQAYRPYNEILKKGIRSKKQSSSHRKNKMKTADVRGKKYDPFSY